MTSIKRTKKEDKKSKKEVEVSNKLKEVLAFYETECKNQKEPIDDVVKDALKNAASNSKYLQKVSFQLYENDSRCIINIATFIKALRKSWYKHIKEIYLFDLQLPYEQIAALEDFLQQPCYLVEYIEFLSCRIECHSLERFSRCLSINRSLTTLVFDYTKIGDRGLMLLADSLLQNNLIVKLSLSYCDLTSKSGEVLGRIIGITAVNELYVDGNYLRCNGLLKLLNLIVDQANMEGLERKAAMECKTAVNTPLDDETKNIATLNEIDQSIKPSDAKKKGRSKKRGKGSAKRKPPKPGPWLDTLQISNNGIDARDGNEQFYEAIESLQIWISNSSNLKEIDFDGNVIGEEGANIIYSALNERKKAGLTNIKINIIARLPCGLFKNIHRFASGSKKKKKGKKKGAKNKRRV